MFPSMEKDESRKNRKSKNLFAVFGVHAVLFLYIYLPNILFLKFATTLFLPLGLITYSLIFSAKNFFNSLRKKEIFLFSLSMTFLVFYAVIIDALSETSSEVPFGSLFSITLIRFLILNIPSSVSLFLIFKHINKGTSRILITSFLWISFFQFLFNMAMLLSPELREFVAVSFLNMGEKLATSSNFYLVRGYGIASGYLFGYPLFNGLVLSSVLWLIFEENAGFMAILLVPLLPIILNARVGLMSIPAFIISYLIFKVKKKSSYRLKTVVLYITYPLIIVSLASYFLTHLFPVLLPVSTVEWIQDGLNELLYLAYLNVDDSVTANILFSSHLHFPRGLEPFLTGEGSYAFFASPMSSDIGYVQMIYFGGLFFTVSLCFAFLWFVFATLKKSKDLVVRGVIVSGTFLVLIANFKGLVFSYENNLLRALILLCIFSLLESDVGNKLKNIPNLF